MSVVACPKCAEKVTLPPKTPAEAKVRCPLCGENYLLSEAMISLPPMLEVVELPEGYSPAEDIDISAKAFLSSPDRTLPIDDDTELKLEGGGVAVAEATEERYDQWGDTRSSEPAHELGEPQVKREHLPPSTSRPRKKKKTINPIYHMVGIVMGGVVAIPAALLILLWMPGDLHRDPMEIVPWLSKTAPFLVPAKLRISQSEEPKDNDTAKPGTVKPGTGAAVATNNGNNTKIPPIDNKFADALKNKGVAFGPGEKGTTDVTPPKPKPEPSIDEPSIDDPLKDPSELVPADPLTVVKPKPEPTPADPLEVDPEPEVKPEPQPEPTPEVVEPAEDPLKANREALASADQAFNTAASGAEKKTAAVAMYRAAAELAARLLGDSPDQTGLELLSKDPMKLLVVGRYATTWLDNKDRPTSGIVLSGNVKSCRAAGERFEVLVELPSSDKREVLIISPKQCEAGQRVFAAGRIVENAKFTVSGYEGDATNAIDVRVIQVVTP